MIARATVSPPTPLSKIPIGALVTEVEFILVGRMRRTSAAHNLTGVII